MKKLAIVITHPIQYYSPLFQRLTERNRIKLKVFYTWPQAIEGFDDPDFGKKISWDIPILEGYDWSVTKNVSHDPGSKTWKGIDCPKLVYDIKSFTPDAVMVFGWKLKSHFRVMRYFKGKVPVYFFGDSTLLDENGTVKRKLRRYALKFVYRYVDKSFYAGQNNRNYFLAHGLTQDQLIFFPHAIDNKRFESTEELSQCAQKWRIELGFGSNDIVVLFCGKFEQKKDPLILIKAMRLARSKYSSLKLLLVGDGVFKNQIDEISLQESWVKVLPFQNQSKMPTVYRLGDVFCLPSKGPGESWGLAVNEAMACGKPVIASDRVGCSIDLVNDGKNGYIFEHSNVDSLIRTFETLIKSDLKKFGSISSDIIKNWTYESKCMALEETLKNEK